MNKQINNTFISIIVNCFNGEKYLKVTLDSILNQTYKNWEVIFWDNQSNDDSAKIFKNYNDERFKYFYAPQHTTLYRARNEAVKKASGEIIAFLDTDDWWNKDKLEKQLLLFKDDKVGLVYSNFYLFYENSKKEIIFCNKKLKSGNITLDLLKNYNVGLLTILIRKTAYNSVLGFGNQYQFCGDFDLTIRVSLKWKIDCIQEPLAYNRRHSSNFTYVNNINHAIEINELERWVSDEKISKDKNLKPHLHYINRRITFLKTIKYINEKRIIKAIKNIIFFPIGFKKIQLFFELILPRSLLKKIKRI